MDILFNSFNSVPSRFNRSYHIQDNTIQYASYKTVRPPYIEMNPLMKKKLIQISAELDKIQFKDRDRRFPIKMSKNTTDNILSCLFFSHCSQIGIKSDEEDARYLLKQNKTFNVRLYDSTSIINSYKIKHDFIVYNSLTFRKDMNKKDISIVSGISKEIIRSFGFDIK